MTQGNRPVDRHTELAAEAFGIKPEEVTPQQREYARSFNFMRDYGAGPQTMGNYFAQVQAAEAAGTIGETTVIIDSIPEHLQDARGPLPGGNSLEYRGMVSGRMSSRSPSISNVPRMADMDSRALETAVVAAGLNNAVRRQDMVDAMAMAFRTLEVPPLRRALDTQSPGRASSPLRESPYILDHATMGHTCRRFMGIDFVLDNTIPDGVIFVEKDNLKPYKKEDILAIRLRDEEKRKDMLRRQFWEGKLGQVCIAKVSLPENQRCRRYQEGRPPMLAALHGQEIYVRVMRDKSGALTLRQLTGYNHVLASYRYCTHVKTLSEAEVKKYMNLQKPRRRINLED